MTLTFCLIRIFKTLVLSISHPSPGFRRREYSLSLLLAHRAASLVLPDVVQEESEGRQGTSGLGTHKSELSRMIFRCIATLKCLRADDVVDGERTAHNYGGKSPFCCTPNVRGRPLESR